MRSAVVLGGSYAGLLAARVLSDHADEVVVLEPDDFRNGDARRGAPHRDQLHALLAMGHTQLERWFPGVTDELVAGGACLGTGRAIQYYVDGMRRPDVPDARMLGASRPFVEDLMRRRVRALPNVTMRVGRARDLRFTGTRVSGVNYTTASDATAGDHWLDADLVVDAMGRSSRLGTWLMKHGWDQAPCTRMKVDLGYATAHFRRGNELPDTVVAHASPGPATAYDYRKASIEPAAITALEGNRWGVVLAAYTDYRPGTDPHEFTERMINSVAPIREVAEKCAMVSEVSTFHFRESQRRDFTALNRFPGGLVAIGDAVASVNPIYGQGLTVAALEASALSAYLRTGTSPHAAAWGYFRRAAVIVNAAWRLSATADLAQPHVADHRPRGYRMTRWAGDKLLEASVLDPTVNAAFMNVMHMREHPRLLSQPRILLAAARALADRARQRRTTPDSTRAPRKQTHSAPASNYGAPALHNALSFWSEPNFTGKPHRAEGGSEDPG
ncbi:FAD-dependent oxidoreductase [Streptomyces sp. NPDC127084]|uniref:FAD-dependent oxidoreductase n=1 Tax=Streptomyces sp. NPDC127084 TaxID=3347133 RepID=UPI00364FCD82